VKRTVAYSSLFGDFRRPTVFASNCTDFPRERPYMEPAPVAGRSIRKNPGPTFVLHRNSDNFRNTVQRKRRVRNFSAPKWKFSCNGFLIFFRISENDCGTFSTEICSNCLLHCAGILTDTVFEKKIRWFPAADSLRFELHWFSKICNHLMGDTPLMSWYYNWL